MQTKRFSSILLLSICLISSLSFVKCDVDTKPTTDDIVSNLYTANAPNIDEAQKIYDEAPKVYDDQIAKKFIGNELKTRLSDISKMFTFQEVLPIFYTVLHNGSDYDKIKILKENYEKTGVLEEPVDQNSGIIINGIVCEYYVKDCFGDNDELSHGQVMECLSVKKYDQFWEKELPKEALQEVNIYVGGTDFYNESDYAQSSSETDL